MLGAVEQQRSCKGPQGVAKPIVDLPLRQTFTIG